MEFGVFDRKLEQILEIEFVWPVNNGVFGSAGSLNKLKECDWKYVWFAVLDCTVDMVLTCHQFLMELIAHNWNIGREWRQSGSRCAKIGEVIKIFEKEWLSIISCFISWRKSNNKANGAMADTKFTQREGEVSSHRS